MRDQHLHGVAGLRQSDAIILSDSFLAEARWLTYKNVAAKRLAERRNVQLFEKLAKSAA